MDWKKIWLFVSFQCVLVLGLLAGGELLCRWLDPGSMSEWSGLTSPPYFFRPSIKTRNGICGKHVFTINSAGVRGSEIGLKQAGIHRILMLGDSIVFGMIVDDDQTIPVQLEAILNQSVAGKRWEVINAGVPSYNVWDYGNFLRYKGLAFEPDIVVLGLCRNDAQRRGADNQYIQTDAAKSSAKSHLYNFMLRSKLFKAMKEFVVSRQRAKFPLLGRRRSLNNEQNARIDELFPGDAKSAAAIKGFIRSYRYEPNGVISAVAQVGRDFADWDATRDAFVDIKKICREKGIPLLVVIFPYQFEAYPPYRWPEPTRRIVGILDKLGIPWLNIQPVLANTDRGDEFFNERGDMGHPSDEGNRIISKALWYRLTELGWLGANRRRGAKT